MTRRLVPSRNVGRRGLWLSAAIAAALLAASSSAQAAPFAYVTNEGGGFGFTLSQYNVRAGGLLAPLSPPTVATGRRPTGLAVHPGGQSVYVANARETYVSQYDIGADGRLSPKSPATVAAGEFPSRIAVSPDGKSAYVTTTTGTPPFPGVVAQYDVGPGGRLSPKNPAMVASGGLGDIVVSPDGRSVYVPAAGRIRQYTVGPGGRLAPKNPPTVAAGPGPNGLAVSPDGRSVYVANTDGNSVSQYNVGAGGRLSPKTPATVAAGDAPVAVAVTPGSRSVYVANSAFSTTFQGTISQYNVGSGGRLSPKTPSEVPAGDLTVGVTVSPNGRSVYVTNNNSATVSQYDIGGGGRLSPKSPPTVATDGGPAEIAITPPAPGWEGRVTNRRIRLLGEGPGALSRWEPAGDRLHRGVLPQANPADDQVASALGLPGWRRDRGKGRMHGG